MGSRAGNEKNGAKGDSPFAFRLRQPGKLWPDFRSDRKHRAWRFAHDAIRHSAAPMLGLRAAGRLTPSTIMSTS